VDSAGLRAILARNIRAYARERGVGHSALADFAGVSRAQLYAVLARRTSPTVDWLAKLSVALEVDASLLLARPVRSPKRLAKNR
jgi:DNA-binding phage protein